MEGLKAIPYIALVIAIAGIIIGSGIIVTDKFQETMSNNGCYNSSYILNKTVGQCYCLNETAGTHVSYAGPSNSNMSHEGYAACQATIGQADLAEQLPTVAIIGIMVIIISIIAGVFVYMRYFA